MISKDEIMKDIVLKDKMGFPPEWGKVLSDLGKINREDFVYFIYDFLEKTEGDNQLVEGLLHEANDIAFQYHPDKTYEEF